MRLLLSAPALLLSCFLSVSAWAGPDQSGSTDLQSAGFPGVCDEPCFTAKKSFEVYLSGNPDTPAGPNCPVGENTYIYKVEHTGGSGTPNPPAFIPGITKFELSVEADDVSSAGFVAGFGINPSATNVNAGLDVIEWDFLSPLIGNGMMSTKLFVCSALLPGNLPDSMVSVDGQLAVEATGTCVGPLFEPAGEPLPCTIGFWKARADGKQGTLKWFPDPEFDQVVTAAVALSNDVFVDEADLLTFLQSKGDRDMQTRAKQQLAATLLNLAAGDLFPANSKCKLFEGNAIDSNSCGDNISVAEAMAFIATNAGTEAAKDCADDLNNGIGVVGAGTGE